MLKRMKIINFAVFKGENVIDFSTDSSSPLTMIFGITATGKTSVADALRWCLGDSLTECRAKNILNVNCIEEISREQSIDVSVQLDFEAENSLVSFTRILSCTNENGSIKYI